MSDLSITQKVSASITYLADLSNRLSKAYPGQTITISSAVGIVDSPAVISSVLGTGTGITFHLAVASVTPASAVEVTLTPTLSNGDVDPITIQVVVSAR